MKTLFASALVALVTAASSFGAAPPLQPVDPSQTPKGLSGSDWSGIRGAYEKNRHAIVANADGSHQARNLGQAWLTKFDGRGFTVTPDAGGWTWGLELTGFGEVSEVRQDGGKISYSREDGLTEWFVNDARGLEQGWTFTKRPARAGASGPIRLNLAVRGVLRPQVAAEGGSVAFLNETGGAALTYGGLKAWDADGKTVLVRFAEGECVGKGLGVMVNDEGARYPITVDPIAQQTILVASNADAADQFGESVAISGDTVVVGAPGEDSGLTANPGDNSRNDSGAAYVFVRSEGSWSQQAYLKGSREFWAAFGYSVAVSGDTVVVGERGYRGTGPLAYENAGGVFVFVRQGTTWSNQTILVAPNRERDDFFGIVAVSGDTIVVGAPEEDSSATGVNGNTDNNLAPSSGAAYVFVRSGTTWNHQAYLKASNTREALWFGGAVAVSGDTVVVGATGDSSSANGVNGNQNDNSASGAGAAYVFMRSEGTWGQHAYLKSSNSDAGDGFGASVAVSGDTVIVGASGEDSNATGVNGDQGNDSVQNSGAAYVFTRGGGAWSQQAYLKASNTGVDDLFGWSVALSGNAAIVGASSEDSSATGVNGNQADNSASDSGAAYFFRREGTNWSQLAYMKPNPADGSHFGKSVAISGETMVVGAAYVFERSYALTVVAEHGTVVGAGNYEANTTATLTPTAAPGYIFTGWTGDATGTDNPLSVLMNSDKTIGATFSPDTNDTDDDGLTNYQEVVEYGTDPTKQDTDNDGVKDAVDGRPLDPTETLDTDRDGTGDNADTDDDGDGLSDVDEINIHGTNSKRADSDGDGLSDPSELQSHLTNPNLADTDSDGLSDGAEINTHGTNPKDGDSDDDGFLDGYEVLTGKLPLDPLSKPALVAEARTAIEFTFPSALGKIYRIEDSFDLSTWGTVESGIAGNGGQIQRFYSTRNVPKRYFRVEEDAP